MFAIFGLGTGGLLVILLLSVFWILMLIDAIQNKGLSDGEKIAWVIVIIFVHFLGALLYLLIGRPKRTRV